MMGWICAVPIIAGFFSVCAQGDPLAVGYVEGEFVLLAPIEIARVEKIAVRKGDRVKAGQALVELEIRDAVIAVTQARAAKHQAAAQLQNLREGKRPEEINVIEASLASAKAEANEARRKLERREELSQRGFAPEADLDAAKTAVELAHARVAELRADLDVARLPAREAEIVAARNRVDEAAAALENAEWRLGQRSMKAPANGTINDVILREGEMSGPSSPVLSIHPDGGTKLKLYVPEELVSSVSFGTKLSVHCDGCEAHQTATVSFVATDPEFTPPVIYSLNNRQKLVYLIEARPDPSAANLKPGQIVDVMLLGGGESSR